MNPSIDVWESPDIGFSEAQQALSATLRKWMRTQDVAFVHKLADFKIGDPPLSCAPKTMQDIQQEIEVEFESARAAYAVLVILSKFVAYVNKMGKGPIPQPRISHLVAKPPNPFRGGIAQELACVRAWLDMERKWIEDCAATPPVELVVLSAMLHGGLLHTSSVVCFTRALLATSNHAYGCIGNRIYVNLSLPWRGEPEMEDRRWFPDEQTASLLRPPEQYLQGSDWQHLNALTNLQVGRRLFQKIRQQMRSEGVRKEFWPATLKQLLDIMATAARTEVPAVLIEYASRRIVSHSLKFDTLQRIYGVAVTPDPTAEMNAPDDAASVVDDLPSVHEEPDDLKLEWLEQLRTAFRTTDTRQARATLETLLSAFPSPSCPGHRITDFALYLLTERNLDPQRFVSRKPLNIRTVEAWTLTVARRFGRILGEQDPVALTVENIETLYTKVLENVVEGDDPRPLRRKVAHALHEFQEFLVRKLGAAPIHDREILGSNRGLLPVDAKVLTLEQYSAARRYIRRQSHHEYDASLRHAAEAMLILGFRCGTRRMEAYGLELSDLTERTSPWLLVRPTEARQLKTDNAKRQLPLLCLMPEDELEVLYSWKQTRIQDDLDGSKACRALFAAPARNENGVAVETPLPVQKLIALLHEAIRHATGDPTLHFHHLRHSFSTWTFLRLMLSDLPRIPDLFPHLPETTTWLRDARIFRQQLYGTPHPTRRHAMAVASLLGHCGPSVSMEHYIHCMDWLLPLFLSESRLLQVRSTHRVTVASALPKSSLYEWEQKLGPGSIPSQIFQQRFPELVAKLNANPPSVSPSGILASVTQSPSASWVRNTWDLLFLRGTTSEPLDELADRLGFDIHTAEAILDRARAIQQILEVTGRKSSRHRMEMVAVDRGNPDRKIAIACPKRSRGKDELNVIATIEPTLWTMAHEDPETIQLVLGYYVQNVWRTSNVLPFRDPDTAKDVIRYRRCLNHLGIVDQKMWFIFFGQHAQSRSRRKWKDALKITWRFSDRIRICEPPFKQSSASERWLGIEPDFRSDTSAKMQGGSDGFRYLLVMAAIRFGYGNEEQ